MAEFIKSIALGFLDTTLEMAPYLLFGFFFAGLLSILISPKLVERHLGGRGIWPVVKASLFGVPLPLCSCGVIPVTTSLYKHGASRASAISFLLSTPQTGVDSIFVTYSLLGWVFAIFRPVAAFITGIFGGAMVNLFDKAPVRTQNNNKKCDDECCHSGPHKSNIWKGLRYGFVALPQDIAWPLIVGIIIAAFITALVPDDFFAEKLPSGFLAMLIMLALGIPVYVCATASVPIVAALIMKGLSPGAAFVFLVTGPATNAATIVTIWKILGHRTAVIYLLSVVGGALAGGLLLDFFSAGQNTMDMVHQHGWMLPRFVNYVSAVALFLVLVFAVIPRRKEPVLTQ